MGGLKYNPIENAFDIAGISQGKADIRYLSLDQTTPQTIENGAPIFDAGIKVGDFLTVSDDGTNANFDLTSGAFVFTGGNVGIGTDSPNNTLQVANLINFNDCLLYTSDAADE